MLDNPPSLCLLLFARVYTKKQTKLNKSAARTIGLFPFVTTPPSLHLLTRIADDSFHQSMQALT